MTKWYEYTELVCETNMPVSVYMDALNSLGRAGWQLQAVIPIPPRTLSLFKRERDEEKEADTQTEAFAAALGSLQQEIEARAFAAMGGTTPLGARTPEL